MQQYERCVIDIFSYYSISNKSARKTCPKYPNTETRKKIRQEKEGHQKALRATICSEASQQLKRQLDHMSRAGTSSWLSARPLKERNLHLSTSDFRDLIRLRYLLPLENMPLTCVCGKDYTITHALTCATGGFIIKRHNDVRDYLAHLLNEVCADVSIESHLVRVTEDETTSTNREDAARRTSRRETFGDPASERSSTFASSMLMRSRTLAGILRRLSVIMREKRHGNTAIESLMSSTGASHH